MEGSHNLQSTQPWGTINFSEYVSMPLKSVSDPSIRSLINSCRTIRHVYQLHAHVIHNGLEQDHFIVSHLLSHSASYVPYSRSIFDRVISPSVILYNILLKIYTCRCHFEETISLFIRMKRGSEHASPDKYTYPSLLLSCSNELRLKEGEIVHGSVIRCGVSDDLYVESSLIDFYGECKKILSASKVFDEMSYRNVVSWTTMVVVYLNVGDLDNAKRMFDQMPERNLTSWNAMIGGLVKAEDLRSARKLFDEMIDRDKKHKNKKRH